MSDPDLSIQLEATQGCLFVALGAIGVLSVVAVLLGRATRR